MLLGFLGKIFLIIDLIGKKTLQIAKYAKNFHENSTLFWKLLEILAVFSTFLSRPDISIVWLGPRFLARQKDPKPDCPAEKRGPSQTIEMSGPGKKVEKAAKIFDVFNKKVEFV